MEDYIKVATEVGDHSPSTNPVGATKEETKSNLLELFKSECDRVLLGRGNSDSRVTVEFDNEGSSLPYLNKQQKQLLENMAAMQRLREEAKKIVNES